MIRGANALQDQKQALAAAALQAGAALRNRPCLRLQSLAAILAEDLDPTAPVDARLIAALTAWREGDAA